MRLRKSGMVAFGLTAALYATAGLTADIEDPYVWLEDTFGAKPLEWVKEHNAVALRELKSDPDYQKHYDSILAVLDANDRIPFGQVYASHVFKRCVVEARH